MFGRLYKWASLTFIIQVFVFTEMVFMSAYSPFDIFSYCYSLSLRKSCVA